MKRGWKLLAGIVLLALAGMSIAAIVLFTSAAPATGRREVEGVGAPVTVFRDDWGVPHIFAETDDDASFALGWVHAEDRLWQMETMRRLGAGRLAEIFGRRSLPSDRWMRTLGLHQLAERDYAALSSETQRKLDAYARGVNAWLTARSGLLPPEFLLSRFEPEPWTAVDSLVWLKLMALRLSGNRYKELLRARLAERLTPEQLRDLWPDDPPDAPTTLAAIATGSDAATLARLSDALAEGAGQPYGASNAWVVAGSKTASGKPILANDPHLGFALPAPVVPDAHRHAKRRAGRRHVTGVPALRPRSQQPDRLGDHQFPCRCRGRLFRARRCRRSEPIRGAGWPTAVRDPRGDDPHPGRAGGEPDGALDATWTGDFRSRRARRVTLSNESGPATVAALSATYLGERSNRRSAFRAQQCQELARVPVGRTRDRGAAAERLLR